MTRSLRDPSSRKSILSRIAKLGPDSQRRWGRMETAQLLPHLASGLKAALGEKILEGPPPGRLKGTFMRVFAIHYLPWPEGKIPAPPGAFNTPDRGWEEDRKAVVELIERFAATPDERLGRMHPAFGPMSARDWDVLQYRHLDHHLRQFGA